jgi:hypothetical protein
MWTDRQCKLFAVRGCFTSALQDGASHFSVHLPLYSTEDLINADFASAAELNISCYSSGLPEVMAINTAESLELLS